MEWRQLDNEWFETNGLGGYAASSPLLCHTRKYHGWLVHPVEGQKGRFVLLNKLVFTFSFPGTAEPPLALDTNQYPGTLFPEGHRDLNSFHSDPAPCWSFARNGLDVEMELLMPRAFPGVLVRLAWKGPAEHYTLYADPLFSFRDSHQLTFENRDAQLRFCDAGSHCRFGLYDGLPELFIHSSAPYRFHPAHHWDKNVEYKKEQERGFDYQEDRFRGGTFHFALGSTGEVFLAAGLENPANPLKEMFRQEARRRKKRRRVFRQDPEPVARLKAKGEDFLIRNREGAPSLIAGYPWFGEWGRDTMIAWQGLTLENDAAEEGIGILETYSRYEKEGLLPNTIGGLQGFESYNSLDASLLFCRCVQTLATALQGKELPAAAAERADRSLREKLIPTMGRIVQAFLNGKVPEARIREDGLLEAGSEETQLTWMDARVYGKAVTPRHGLAVDLNALWYNACGFLKDNRRSGDSELHQGVKRVLESFPAAFRRHFMLPEGFLSDTAKPTDEGKSLADGKLRPNMLWAAALPFSVLTREEKQRLMERAAVLKTKAGLRTLDPQDPDFIPVYSGTGPERDRAYHQGTVWPWLTGLYTEALYRTYRDLPEWGALRDRLRSELLAWITEQIDSGGLGSLSEVYDGGSPSDGKGCFAQAWSVAETIRAWNLLSSP